ncbi:MAG TPA: formylmethanofuran dehydrogenase subunit C [Methylophilus sp.]
MSALTFTLKANITVPIDCSRLTPNGLAALTPSEIEHLVLTPTKYTVSDVFALTGEDAQQMVFKNAKPHLHHIGHSMSTGSITIEGDCGDFLGSQMQGGTLICKGNAGERAGDKMRRGLLLIEGNVGEYCGASMIAGTIGVLGNVGARLGYGMRRGTLLLAKTPTLSATWLDCGMHTLPFLNILYQSFKLLDTAFAQVTNQRVQRWMGDVSHSGKAEILVIQSQL